MLVSAMEANGLGKVVSEPRITTLIMSLQRFHKVLEHHFFLSSGGTQVQFVDAMFEGKLLLTSPMTTSYWT